MFGLSTRVESQQRKGRHLPISSLGSVLQDILCCSHLDGPIIYSLFRGRWLTPCAHSFSAAGYSLVPLRVRRLLFPANRKFSHNIQINIQIIAYTIHKSAARGLVCGITCPCYYFLSALSFTPAFSCSFLTLTFSPSFCLSSHQRK